MESEGIRRSNWDITVRETIIKTVEALVQSRTSHSELQGSDQIGSNSIQTIIEETQAIRSLFPNLIKASYKEDFRFHLEFYLIVESCHPLLVERWEFNITPIPKHNEKDFESEAVLFLRSVLLASVNLPTYTKLAGKLKYQITFEKSKLLG